MSLKQNAMRLEKLCQTQRLLVFQYEELGYQRAIPVLTEYATDGPEEKGKRQYEYFRARATHPQAMTADFHMWHNQVSVIICHTTKTVKFGPHGQLIMSLKGKRLGPALMAHVVAWLLRQNCDTYAIDPGSLSRVDAETNDARVQRNSFYMAFNFQLSNFSGTQTGKDVVDGSFTAPNVGSLHTPSRYQNLLTPWSKFEQDLSIHRFDSRAQTEELVKIDTWTDRIGWARRWLLELNGWPNHFNNRFKYIKKNK